VCSGQPLRTSVALLDGELLFPRDAKHVSKPT
jgi:hypothetical protein